MDPIGCKQTNNRVNFIVFLKFESIEKPHPATFIWRVIDSTPILDTVNALRVLGDINLLRNNAIYLAHCLCKARYLQVRWYLVFSFNFTFKLSLVLNRCKNCCYFVVVFDIFLKNCFWNFMKNFFFVFVCKWCQKSFPLENNYILQFYNQFFAFIIGFLKLNLLSDCTYAFYLLV